MGESTAARYKLTTAAEVIFGKASLRIWFRKGESLLVVGKLHTQQTTARYADLADAALSDAANRFGQLKA